MRRFLIFLSLCFSFLFCSAQENFEIIRGGCLPTGLPQHSYANSSLLASPRRMPTINNQWDASRTYRQLVILVEFCDQTFELDNARNEYELMLNEPGYNGSKGPGCMADYYREQSNGLFNLQFDIYGPYTVSQKAQPYDNPDNKTRNYGRESLIEATNLFLEENSTIDFSQYDWNGNGYVNQVIYIYAGVSGNITSQAAYGHIWPNTSIFSTITTPDGLRIRDYSCSGEKWPTSVYRSCGIGTICHEFSHSLGLPDIYPTNGWCMSICDEWDLMDGGNFTNYGWCPTNYTPLEKMLLGWLTPVELQEPAGIVALKPVSEGGEVYRVMLADNGDEDAEYVLIENRQQTGWDKGAPGCGLMAWHVHYHKGAWSSNSVNNKKDNPYFHPIYADGLNYVQWREKCMNEGLSIYQNSYRMNSRLLSTSPFPYMDQNAIPEAEITNILVDDDGLASFDFRRPNTGIEFTMADGQRAEIIYTIDGRRIDKPQKGVNIIRTSDGQIRKVVIK